jgi:hypothetical protein
MAYKLLLRHKESYEMGRALRVYGGVMQSTVHPPSLAPDQIDDVLAWARNPAKARKTLTIIPSSATPSLKLVTPRCAGMAFIAAQLDFDALAADGGAVLTVQLPLSAPEQALRELKGVRS